MSSRTLLYPAPIFRGAVKVLLLTAIPAGFMAHVPVQLLRQFDAGQLPAALRLYGADLGADSAGFRAGLRRYESGNLVRTRG